MEIPDDLIESLLPAVEEQLHSPQTSYVKKTYESLIGKHNLEAGEAMELIAQALAIVINNMMIDGRPFDTNQYKQLLSNLPDLPDESAQP